MKKWVLTFRVEPPPHVVSARTGGSVFFAAYSRWLRQWYLVANGAEEMIDEPQMLYLDEDYVRAHPSENPVRRKSGSHLRRQQSKAEQLQLF